MRRTVIGIGTVLSLSGFLVGVRKGVTIFAEASTIANIYLVWCGSDTIYNFSLSSREVWTALIAREQSPVRRGGARASELFADDDTTQRSSTREKLTYARATASQRESAPRVIPRRALRVKPPVDDLQGKIEARANRRRRRDFIQLSYRSDRKIAKRMIYSRA